MLNQYSTSASHAPRAGTALAVYRAGTMCGIGGIIRFDGPPIEEHTLDRMYEHLRLRGPDGRGRFRDSAHLASGRTIEAALVHARLSIIDHEGGTQPMLSCVGEAGCSESNDDPDLCAIVFNGCIYNHRELRIELEQLGHQFHSHHSDTEVILRGYQQWGADELPDHLDGMFAYGIWDRRQRVLILSRDRAGEKPLYVWMNSDGRTRTLVFGSTIGAAMVLGNEFDNANLPPLHQVVPWHLVFLKNGYCTPTELPVYSLHLLGPGETLTIGELESNSVHPRRYWSAAKLAHQRGTNQTDSWDLDATLRKAVHSRMEADVPLGCFLSGGVDSSLITKYASEVNPDLRTFCVRMPTVQYDESDIAAQIAEILGTNHKTLEAEMSPADDLVHLIRQLGQPFGDSSILPTYWVSEAAKQHVKVALSGDGGDELFAGYERFKAADWLKRYRTLLRLIPAWPLNRFSPKSKWNKLARLAHAARGDGYSDLTPFFRSDELLRLDERWKGRPVPTLPSGGVPEALFDEFTLYLPDDLLRKVDTASMLVGLEVRAPFLAKEIIEGALSSPVSKLMPHGERKGWLKQIARNYFPRRIVNRPKMGFAIPIGEWFRNDYGQLATLLNDSLNSTEPFGDVPIDLVYVRRILSDHMAGKFDHSHRLFALLTLSIWARECAICQQAK